MKKILLVLAFLGCAGAYAHDVHFSDLTEALPVDPQVRVGELANGLRYYIRHNRVPEDKVELRLALDAGSLVEDEDQLGLAHFVEHMAFNGSEHFEKNELLEYVQSVGVEFGAHVNAYTSFDETVYKLPIASDDPEVLDTAFLILRDWAGGLSFDAEEVEKERGVVIEEWRQGRDAMLRVQDEWLPLLLKDSRYAERMPIGSVEIVEHFEHDTLRRFYRDWYRPDLMAVIVVGDVDVDDMEAKIYEYFADLEGPQNPRPRRVFSIPDHSGTDVVVRSDPELAFTQVIMASKFDVEDTTTLGDYRRDLTYHLFAGMFNARLDELRQQADPSFIYAGSGVGQVLFSIRNKQAFHIFARADETDIARGLRSLFEEGERVLRYGFTYGEYDRYKKIMLRRFETAYNERDKSESQRYADEYVRSFLEAEAIPGIEFEFAFVSAELDHIALEEVNALAAQWFGDDNRTIVLTAPQKVGVVIPSVAEITEEIAAVRELALERYEDEVVSSELMTVLPTAGELIGRSEMEEIGVTELRLSNGARVLLKATDFKNDEIVMQAYSRGGHSLASDEMFLSARYAADIVSESGVGAFSANALKKALAGTSLSLVPYIDELLEGLDGRSAPDDLETFFQLVHLYFTEPREDETAFLSFVEREIAQNRNVLADPQRYFQDQFARLVSQHHLRGRGISSPDDIAQIDHDDVMNFYRERFGDAGDFTFFFVGAFELEEMIELCQRYLASLPGGGSAESWKDLGIRAPSGSVDSVVRKGSEEASQVLLYFTEEVSYSREDAFLLDKLGKLLDIKLTANLREEQSGVYSIYGGAGLSFLPYSRSYVVVQFPCAPENVESLTQAAVAQVSALSRVVDGDDDIQKVREQYRRRVEEGLKQNDWWASTLFSYDIHRVDLREILSYAERMELINAEQFRRVAEAYIDAGEYIRMVLYPEQR